MRIKTKDAIEHFGSVAALAAALDITTEAVYQWGEFVPRGRAFEIHVYSKKALPRAEGAKAARGGRRVEA